MVHVIDATNRARFGLLLADMYGDRARVFRTWLKSVPPVWDGTDQFDTSDATYLVETDPHDTRHLASVRILPTTRPHLLTTEFAHLCDSGAPIGTGTRELSWFCISAEVRAESRQRLSDDLRRAAVDFAASRGIREYIGVIALRFLPEIMATGWTVKPLGLPVVIGEEAMGAMLFTLSAPWRKYTARNQLAYRGGQ